ncbi:AlpA family phage regulatory protein [Frateuria sp. Soil773]|uniref:helix-turn-helix transcriptional regulator n=1 Tax=Frateuria sp. Soil773 TaxID=1736407 RepID=UPI0009EB28E5|nr:AlpA family phage regulatory protein [Frateuria sp. Soil773]
MKQALPNGPALLRLPTVLQLVGVSKSTLYRWAEAGMFPKPRALTPTRSTVAWSASEVHTWIAAKLGATAAQEAAPVGTFVGTFDLRHPQAA